MLITLYDALYRFRTPIDDAQLSKREEKKVCLYTRALEIFRAVAKVVKVHTRVRASLFPPLSLSLSSVSPRKSTSSMLRRDKHDRSLPLYTRHEPASRRVYPVKIYEHSSRIFRTALASCRGDFKRLLSR